MIQTYDIDNLKKYLTLVKQNFIKNLDNPVDNLELNVVIGNESCDLDSNIGSIMMA